MAAQRLAHVDFEQAARLHRVFHLRREELVAAPAAVLGRIERHVGLLQQLIRIGAIRRRHGNADRSADIETVTVHLERFGDCPKQALRKPFRVLPVSVPVCTTMNSSPPKRA